MIYAGAQKNLGPAGVTVVIIREEMLEKCADNIPLVFTYKTHADKDWLYNTPPAFPVYVVKLILEWIKGQGGLEAVEKVNMAKKDYYRGTVREDSRSWMNITMRLPSEELEKKFIAEAKAAGFVGLKGHRSVGGIRVSLYNALPMAGAEGLAKFMEAFKKNN
jgi:phosphoserine aminotransferase